MNQLGGSGCKNCHKPRGRAGAAAIPPPQHLRGPHFALVTQPALCDGIASLARSPGRSALDSAAPNLHDVGGRNARGLATRARSRGAATMATRTTSGREWSSAEEQFGAVPAEKQRKCIGGNGRVRGGSSQKSGLDQAEEAMPSGRPASPAPSAAPPHPGTTGNCYVLFTLVRTGKGCSFRCVRMQESAG